MRYTRHTQYIHTIEYVEYVEHCAMYVEDCTKCPGCRIQYLLGEAEPVLGCHVEASRALEQRILRPHHSLALHTPGYIVQGQGTRSMSLQLPIFAGAQLFSSLSQKHNTEAPTAALPGRTQVLAQVQSHGAGAIPRHQGTRNTAHRWRARNSYNRSSETRALPVTESSSDCTSPVQNTVVYIHHILYIQ